MLGAQGGTRSAGRLARHCVLWLHGFAPAYAQWCIYPHTAAWGNTMLVVVGVAVLGYNTNMTTKSYTLAPVVSSHQVHYPCGNWFNVTNQLPQALVDITGYGEHGCIGRQSRSSPVVETMPAAGTLGAHRRHRVPKQHDVPAFSLHGHRNGL